MWERRGFLSSYKDDDMTTDAGTCTEIVIACIFDYYIISNRDCFIHDSIGGKVVKTN